MRDARQVFWGIITALISIALLFGVFSISLVEGNMRQTVPTLPPTSTSTPIAQPSPSLTYSVTPLPAIITPTLPATITSTLPLTPTNCPPPSGWRSYTIQPGDTLDGLALQVKKTSAEISQANCLGSAGLSTGLVIYLPPVPTGTATHSAPTSTAVQCGAPPTWIIYIVKPGDTLYHLGQAYGIPYTDIVRANCLTSTILRPGQRLYVPAGPTRTPSPTIRGVPSDTPIATWTDIPSTTPTPEISIPTDTTIDTPTETATQ